MCSCQLLLEVPWRHLKKRPSRLPIQTNLRLMGTKIKTSSRRLCNIFVSAQNTPESTTNYNLCANLKSPSGLVQCFQHRFFLKTECNTDVKIRLKYILKSYAMILLHITAIKFQKFHKNIAFRSLQNYAFDMTKQKNDHW